MSENLGINGNEADLNIDTGPVLDTAAETSSEPETNAEALKIEEALAQELEQFTKKYIERHPGKFQGIKTYLNNLIETNKVAKVANYVLPGFALGIAKTGFRAAAGVSGGWALLSSAAISGIYGGVRGYMVERAKQYSYETTKSDINKILFEDGDESAWKPERLMEVSNQDLVRAYQVLSEQIHSNKIFFQNTDQAEDLISRYKLISSTLLGRQFSKEIDSNTDESRRAEVLTELLYERDSIYLEENSEEINEFRIKHFGEKQAAIWRTTGKRALIGAAGGAVGYVLGHGVGNLINKEGFLHETFSFGSTADAEVSYASTEPGNTDPGHGTESQVPSSVSSEQTPPQNIISETNNFSGGVLDPSEALRSALVDDKHDLENLLNALQNNENVKLDGIELSQEALNQIDDTGQKLLEKITDNSLPIDQYLYAHGVDAGLELDNGQTLIQALQDLINNKELMSGLSEEQQQQVLYEVISYPREFLENTENLEGLVGNVAHINPEDSSAVTDWIHQKPEFQQHYVEHLGRAIDRGIVDQSQAIEAIKTYADSSHHNLDLYDNKYNLSSDVKDLLGSLIENNQSDILEGKTADKLSSPLIHDALNWLNKHGRPYTAGALALVVLGLGAYLAFRKKLNQKDINTTNEESADILKEGDSNSEKTAKLPEFNEKQLSIPGFIDTQTLDKFLQGDDFQSTSGSRKVSQEKIKDFLTQNMQKEFQKKYGDIKFSKWRAKTSKEIIEKIFKQGE